LARRRRALVEPHLGKREGPGVLRHVFEEALLVGRVANLGSVLQQALSRGRNGAAGAIVVACSTQAFSVNETNKCTLEAKRPSSFALHHRRLGRQKGLRGAAPRELDGGKRRRGCGVLQRQARQKLERSPCLALGGLEAAEAQEDVRFGQAPPP